MSRFLVRKESFVDNYEIFDTEQRDGYKKRKKVGYAYGKIFGDFAKELFAHNEPKLPARAKFNLEIGNNGNIWIVCHNKEGSFGFRWNYKSVEEFLQEWYPSENKL